MSCWGVHSEWSWDLSSGSVNGDRTVIDAVPKLLLYFVQGFLLHFEINFFYNGFREFVYSFNSVAFHRTQMIGSHCRLSDFGWFISVYTYQYYAISSLYVLIPIEKVELHVRV